MLPEIGHFSLILALCLAALQVLLPVIIALTQQAQLWCMVRSAALCQFVLVMLAFLLLIYAFASNDFSVLYVAENSNTQLPLLYRLCAVWGAHEGSILLWIVILNIWTFVLCWVRMPSQSRPFLREHVLSVLALIECGFLSFLLFTSNPWQRLLQALPKQGQDLNPLLQDPGFVSHPPILYAGYVGLAVPFAFIMVALWQGDLSRALARYLRIWVLVAWAFLTLGIVLGSWWAYRQLGWGGWWFWDPVENASFMPWLVATALFHSLMITERCGAFKAWTVLLTIFAFALSLLGTFLVRSGVLISVHAFATDPQRGLFILLFLGFVVGGSLLLYALRVGKFTKGDDFAVISRESLLLSNNVILTTAAFTVFLGTLYPLLLNALDLGKISVGAPYFNWVFVPLMLLLFFFMGIAPRCDWHAMAWRALWRRLWRPMLLACVISLLIPLLLHTWQLGMILGLWGAFWVSFSVLLPHANTVMASGVVVRRLGMRLAHLGMAVTTIGILMVTLFSDARLVKMAVGDQVALHSYQFTLLALNQSQGPNYQILDATIGLQRSPHSQVTLLHPQTRYYPVRAMALAKVALDVNVVRDLYVALGMPVEHGKAWVVRIYYKPFVRWIWFGGLLMMLGAVAAIVEKYYRRGKKT